MAAKKVFCRMMCFFGVGKGCKAGSSPERATSPRWCHFEGWDLGKAPKGTTHQPPSSPALEIESSSFSATYALFQIGVFLVQT